MADPTHNSAGLGMDPADFDKHVAKISAAKIALDTAKTAYKGVRKAFQTRGGVLGDLDLMIKDRDLGHEEAIARMKRLVSYGKRVGTFPRATQLEMFDGVTLDPAVDRARDEGKFAGLTGKDQECPHEPGVPQREAWLEGWHAGHAVFLEAAKAAANERDGGIDVLNEEDEDGTIHPTDADIGIGGDEPPMPYYEPTQDEVAAGAGAAEPGVLVDPSQDAEFLAEINEEADADPRLAAE